MHKSSLFVVVAALAATAVAKCPNECSGKGTCGENDLCSCFAGYTGLDCSGRKCLYGKAWGDAPSGNEYAHDYTECSGQGECDRKTGECKCNDGFTGDGCRYSACPNDCSGHGKCEFISEVTGSDTAAAGRTHIKYSEFVDLDRSLDLSNNWDTQSSRGCRCDPYYSGDDCSVRMCPKGNDPLTKTTALSAQSRNYYTSMSDIGVAELEKPEVQTIVLSPVRTLPSNSHAFDAIGGHFSLTYTDMYGQGWTTRPIRVKSKVVTAATADIADGATGQSIISNEEGVFGMFQDHDNILVEYTSGLPQSHVVKVIEHGAGFQGLLVQPRITAVTDGALTLTLINQDCGEIGVTRALTELPNQVIPSVTVDETITTQENVFRVTFSDSANAGDQAMLSCKVDACNSDGCQPRKDAMRAQLTVDNGAAVTFNAGNFQLTFASTKLTDTMVFPGDHLAYGHVTSHYSSTKVTHTAEVLSMSGTVATLVDRTISLADSTAGHISHALVNLNDRDKRSALSITHACADGAGAICTIAANGQFVTANNDGTRYSVGDVVLVTSLPPAGTDKSPNEGLHRVTATASAVLTLSRVDGGAITVVTDGDQYGTIVITRVSTFPCSVVETRKGTAESMECSGRGTCDGSTGQCECFEGYTSDDCSMQTVLV